MNKYVNFNVILKFISSYNKGFFLCYIEVDVGFCQSFFRLLLGHGFFKDCFIALSVFFSY